MPRLRAPPPHGTQAVSQRRRRQCPLIGTPRSLSKRIQSRGGAKRCQGVEKGPVARRRPTAAREAYSCTLSVQPRAPTKQMGPYRRPGSVEDGLGRVRRVVVEAAPALAPEVAALDALLELLGRPVGLVLGRLVGLEAGVVADVEAREVAEPEGARRGVGD